ncbi:carboxymuconolactone decarboxylase family protein [uncultured Anaeromusa sp.]|uniref:carboxymuconolactone decarboxylase family protein n=1 Tax=uncultured Anaeromusa sp. TaxID=673273 RepID=UPI0029C7CA40|nr:carboxymuconolactone decarboxylase family protein [uncultured Anaeromusa sp.]
MAISEQVRSLISIGVSVGVNCQPCLQYHVEKAKENGIDESEILEAIATGKAVRKGAAYKMDEYIKEISGKNTTRTAERELLVSHSCCKS